MPDHGHQQPPQGWQRTSNGNDDPWGAPPPPGGWPSATSTYYVTTHNHPPAAAPHAQTDNGHGNGGNQQRGVVETVSGKIGLYFGWVFLILGLVLAGVFVWNIIIVPGAHGIRQEGVPRAQEWFETIGNDAIDISGRRNPGEFGGNTSNTHERKQDRQIKKLQQGQDKTLVVLNGLVVKVDGLNNRPFPSPDTVIVTVTPEPSATYPPCGPDLQPRPCTTDP